MIPFTSYLLFLSLVFLDYYLSILLILSWQKQNLNGYFIVQVWEFMVSDLYKIVRKCGSGKDVGWGIESSIDMGYKKYIVSCIYATEKGRSLSPKEIILGLQGRRGVPQDIVNPPLN